MYRSIPKLSSARVSRGLCFLLLVLLTVTARAELLRYDIGSPVLTDIWVDPVAGNDTRAGNSRAQALRTLTEAWRRLPSVTTTTGYRIQLMAGTFPESSLPTYWEGKRGSQAFPLIIQSADGPRTARLQGNVNVFQVGFLYWLGLTFDNPGDVFHCEQCDHLLIRDSRLTGGIRQAHETIKMNQSQYIYIEDSEVSESYENAIDFVAVQYGHIVRNHLHDADDWCIYLKGGSAYFRVEDNEIDHCGTGGFTAGQGTGFEYMTPPWLHHEAYGLRVVNNVIHDTEGAGLGVNGGYAILMAYNTLYRVGSRSHVAEFVFGGRSCDGEATRCAQNLALGGWGTTLVGSEGEPIPNASVYFYNNLIFNPAGYQSAWQHFAIHGPRLPAVGSGIPSPAVTDRDLRIRGNVIWNGPADHPLGLDEGSGCLPGNPTCNETQLRADNAINTLRPELVNPEQGDFHPLAGSALFQRASLGIPVFPAWTVFRPAVPAGNPLVAVSQDRDGRIRVVNGPVGAYSTTTPSASIVTASITAANKTYDGTATAIITACTLTGVAAGDTVTCSAGAASFSDANAGSGKTVTATGITLAGANANKYTLTSTSATTTANIAKASATVTLGNLNRTYSGSPLSPTVTTNPAGLSVSLSGAPQTNAGTYPVTATVTNPNYTGAASGTFVIAKAAQPALVLTAMPTSIPSGGGAGATLTVTGGIGGAVTYAATGSTGTTCILSGNTLSATGAAGNCSVKATHPGNGNYQPFTSNTVTVSVTQPVNVAPVAVNDAFTLLVTGTTPITVPAPSILANDTDANRDVLKVAGSTPRTITLASSGGLVTLQQNGSFTYTPPSASFSGVRTFTYQVTDGKLTSNTATVTFSIARRPSATADTTATAVNTAKVINVLANDKATAPATLNPASIVITSVPANDIAQPNANGTVTYTPQTGYAGSNNFSYTVKDSLGSTSNPATVTVHVPQARNDSYSVIATTSSSQTVNAASVALNDVPNVSGRTFARLSNPVRTSGTGTGTMTVTSFNTSTGAFSYRLNGTQTAKRGTFQFSYRMSLGGVNTAPATVTITVR